MKKKEFLKLIEENPYEYCLLYDAPVACPMYSRPYKGVCLGEHTEEISSYSFEKCNELEIIVFNDCLKRIGDGAFVNTKIKKITIPDSVEEIGKEIFPACIEEFSIPLKCVECLNFNSYQYLTDITVKENRIIVKKAKRYDSVNLYLKCDHFNFRYFSYFRDINFVHVGENVIFTFDKSISETIPLFVDKLFLENLNSDYRLVDGCLFRDSDGYPLIYKRQKIVKIASSITKLKYFPSLNHWKCEYTKFDISSNGNFVKSDEIIKNKDGRVLFIPDEEEVFLFNCHDFALNVLQNHLNLKKLIVCCDDNDRLDINSFLEMIGYYCFKPYSNDYRGPRRYDHICVVIPKQFAKAVSSSSINNKINIMISDIEEPLVTLE